MTTPKSVMNPLIHRGQPGAGYLLLPGEGELLALGGGPLRLLASGDRTGGTVGAWYDEVPPGGALFLHIHHLADELFYVLAGEFRFQVGETVTTVSEGSFVFIPRGAVHAYRNVGNQTGRLLGFVTPAGLEEFYRAQAQRPPEQMTPELYSELATHYDFAIVGPKLA